MEKEDGERTALEVDWANIHCRTKEDAYTNKGRADGRWHEGVTSYFSILRTGWELKGVRRPLSKR